jgi:hypothetical protein
MLPLVGDAPIARNSVVRAVGVPVVPQVTVATCTQVRPFPERVGMVGVFALVFVTQMRFSRFAAGVKAAVVYVDTFVVLLPRIG